MMKTYKEYKYEPAGVFRGKVYWRVTCSKGKCQKVNFNTEDDVKKHIDSLSKGVKRGKKV